MAKKPAPSKGAKLLLRAARSAGGLTALAEQLGVSRQRLTWWVAETCRPNHAARVLLSERLAIPAGAWDR